MRTNLRELRKILDWLDAQPSVSRIMSAAAQMRKLPNLDLPNVSISVLRDSTLEHLLPYIEVACFRKGLSATIKLSELTTAQRDVRNPQSEIYQNNPDFLVLALRLQNLAPEFLDRFATLSSAQASELEDAVLRAVVSTLGIARRHSKTTLLVHNFELPRFPATVLADAKRFDGKINRIRRLNLRLAEQVSQIEQSYIVDVEYLVSRIGGDHAFDSRLWHVAQIPYTQEFFAVLAECYSRFAAALKGKVKKCLVLDCDNTLWGGVVGEEGLSGIELGASHPGSAYRALQMAILELHRRGVLLAINSKNNEGDVIDVLNNHPDCVLKPHHFAAMRINWNDKATNMREIAAELNIGLDSLVFIDDNEVECGLVSDMLPEVTVIQLGPDPTTFEALLCRNGSFDTLAVTAEDLGRSELLRADRQRKQLQADTGSYEDYLKTLEMVVTIECGGADNGSRISQLTQKTNQFNLTTQRYSEMQIRAILQDAGALVYSVRLSDRFGESGLIGVAIVIYDGGCAKIDTFLLSCRVIARGVEDALLAAILEDAKSRSCAVVEGSYIPTAKNAIVADFYTKRGFVRTEDNNFKFNIENLPIPLPGWFKEIKRINK